MSELIGQQFGNYQLTRLLGKGGFAEVYLGEHTRLKMSAAIKILHTHLSEEGAGVFQREAQAIASLIHPHIVRILDFNVKENRPFLVLDYAPGGSLRKLHPHSSHVSLLQTVDYVNQIAEALQYAHEHKLIHCDVKPANMLLGRRNEVLLSDFGIVTIAHATASMSMQSSMGTLPYMAPEQIQVHPRPASDQYALAITVYQWLCGELPFQGSSTEIITKHLAVPPPSLREKVPSIPPEVEQVVMTALAKDPKARFASVQAFANALEQASKGITQPKISENLPRTLVKTAIANDTTEMAPITPGPVMQSLPLSNLILSPPASTPKQQGVNSLPGSSLHHSATRRKVLIGVVGAGILASGGGIALWARATNRLRLTLSPVFPTPQNPLKIPVSENGEGVAVAWSPDGKRIVLGNRNGSITIWDATTGKHILSYENQSVNIGLKTVSWSPDNKSIVSAGTGEIRVAEANSGKTIFRVDMSVDASASWSPDSQRIVGSDWWGIYMWNVADGKEIVTRANRISYLSVAWSPDGQLIAAGNMNGQVEVWDAVTVTRLSIYTGHQLTAAGAPNGRSEVAVVAWSPDSKRIASGGNDGTVQIWKARDGLNTFTYHGHDSEDVTTIAWSPDGRRIASGALDANLQVWNVADGQHVFSYLAEDASVYSVAWSRDSQIAVVDYDNIYVFLPPT